MPSYYINNRKHPLLSERMNHLKKKIHDQTLKNISLRQQIHTGSSVLSTISSGIANSINLLSSILIANKDIPVVGFFLQMLSMIPRSISTLTDPDKSIAEKIFAAVFIGTIVTLSTAAFIIGSLVATILGTAAALFITAMEGINLGGKIVEKMQASRRYNKKRDFEALIAQQQVPEGNQFDDLLEVRTVELRHLIKDKALTQEEKHTLSEELHFISQVLRNKNRAIADNPKKPAFILQELYQKRGEYLTKLTAQMFLIDSKPTEHILLKDIQNLQKEILLIDQQIAIIVPPLEQLNIENMMVDEQLALATSSFLLATAGSILSVLGLLLVLGSIAIPPFIAPVLIGLGVGMAAVSLAKFGVEKFAEHQDAYDKKKSLDQHKEFILEEALSGYESQLNPDNPGVGISSHAKYMQGLLPKNEPIITTLPETSLKEPQGTYENPVFKKPVSSVELTNTPEKIATDDITPTS